MAFKNACCCCGLAAGTETIGWFSITIILLQFIGMVTRSNSAVNGVNDGSAIFPVLGSFVQLFVCGCLVAGARQRDNCMLLPWIVLNIIGFIVINVVIIPLIIAENARKTGGSAEFFITMLVITDLIYGYLLLVVSSLYIEIKQQKRAAKEGINYV